MMSKEIRREYKHGREKNIFLRVDAKTGTYFLEKITKGCGFTITAGTEMQVTSYIEKNGYRFVGLCVMGR